MPIYSGHRLITTVLAAALLISCGRQTSYRVPGGGMEPAIAMGQTIEVDRDAYRSAADIRRGDIVVLRSPGAADSLFVKRVVGLPGERISVKQGRVSINGVALGLTIEGITGIEDAGQATYRVFLAPPCEHSSDEAVVPADAVYVLGDNRCASLDSRRFGAVSFSAIQGRVLLDE